MDVCLSGLCRGLLAAIVVVIALGVAWALHQSAGADPGSALALLLKQFDLEGEGNVQAWFGSALLLFAALLAAATAQVERRVHGEPGGWRLAALILCYLSIDEVAQLHEKTNRLLVRAVDAPAGIDVIGLALVALVSVLLLRFVLRLDAPTRWGVLLGGAVFVTGAAGIEFAARRWLMLAHDAAPVALIVTPAEELLEMLGVFLVIRALLRRLANASGRLELRLGTT